MKTEDLIRAIATDAGRRPLPLRRSGLMTGALAAAVAGLVFFYLLGPRPDFADALQTMRFAFKFALTLTLAACAFLLLDALLRPAGPAPARLRWLAIVPLLLAVAVALELLAVPSSEWITRLVGTNSRVCLTFIPLIGAGPLALCLFFLRHGAPTRPALAGAAAGLLAGSLAAFFYAAHCPDDSPLFVATWYTIAILILTGIGALLAPRIARW